MIRVAFNTTVKIGGKEQSLPTNIQGEFPFVVEGEIVKISNVFDDEIVEVNLNDCLIGDLPEMEIPNEDYKIEYKGFTIYEGKIGSLVEHFEIWWHDEYDCWDSEKLGVSGKTIRECIDNCIKWANKEDVDKHEDHLIGMWNGEHTNFDYVIANLRQGDLELWEWFDFSYIAIEKFFSHINIDIFKD